MAAYEWVRLRTRDLHSMRCALPLAALLGLSDVLDATMGNSRWHACLVAVSLGAQNSLTAAEFGVNTTMMTGNLGKVGTCLVELCALRLERSSLRKHAVYPLCVIATIVGAVFGAFLHKLTGHVHFQFVPIAVLQAASLLAGGFFDAALQSPPHSQSPLARIVGSTLSSTRRTRRRWARTSDGRQRRSATESKASILALDSAAEIARESGPPLDHAEAKGTVSEAEPSARVKETPSQLYAV